MKTFVKKITILIFLAGTVVTVQSSGFIIAKNNQGVYNKLGLRYEKVNVAINDMVAFTEVEQTFYNNAHHNLEGYFYFPLPKNAIIDKFSMYINGKEMQAEMLEAGKARKIYEDIVRSMRDPALLEFSENNLLKVRIFPIEAHKEKKIKISYTEKLERNNGTTEYNFLLKNKYIDKSQPSELIFNIAMQSSREIKNIFSPTHEMDIVRKSEKTAKISFESNHFRPDDVLKLYYTCSQQNFGHSLLTFFPKNENGFFMCNINPGMQTEKQPKDLAIVLDVSGSMSGEKLTKAKNALRFILNSLETEDRFNIIRFSTEATALYGQLESAKKNNIDQAKEFLQNLKAIGGTNIEEALQMALRQQNSKIRPFHIMFITDGKPTIGQTDYEKLITTVKLKNTDNTRIFTLGIGTDVNTHLLDKIAEETRAFRTYILPDEDIEIKISDFYSKIAHPALTDISITTSKEVKILDVYPKNIPDLFFGESLTIFGRYIGNKQSSINLKGKVKGEEKGWSFKADFQDHKQENEYIPKLWAVRAVAEMMEQTRLHGSSPELKEEIVRLAKEYGVITPYTSYLILEDERINIGRNRPVPMSFDDIVEIVEEKIEADAELMEEVVVAGYGTVKKSMELNEMNQIRSVAGASSNQQAMQKGKINKCKTAMNSGRAFYLNHKNEWIDSRLMKSETLPEVNIKFGSKAYFELLKNHPECGKILALGNNVRFLMNQKIVNIFE